MRKGLIAILLLATMIFNTTTTAFAAPVDDNIRNRKEKVKQERVGEIMNELNRMAAEDKYDMIKLANGKALDVKCEGVYIFCMAQAGVGSGRERGYRHAEGVTVSA